VQESIGFNKERGDSVKVINAPFKVAPPSKDVSPPLWRQPEVIDILRTAAVPVGLALVALIVFFGMVRPALKVAFAPPPAPAPGDQVSAVVDDDQVLPALESNTMKALPSPQYSQSLEQARQMAKQNPTAAASIVSGWVSGSNANQT
jgi:flagellar M-ring protein FliF